MNLHPLDDFRRTVYNCFSSTAELVVEADPILVAVVELVFNVAQGLVVQVQKPRQLRQQQERHAPSGHGECVTRDKERQVLPRPEE